MRTFNITVNGQTYVVDVEEVGGVQAAAPGAAAPGGAGRPAGPTPPARLPWRAANPLRRPCPATFST